MLYTPTSFHLKKNSALDIPAPELLWPQGIPAQAMKDCPPEKTECLPAEETDDRNSEYYLRFVSHISAPALYAFPAQAENNTGKAVLICPGGGYVGVAIDHEGFDEARFLNRIGVSAFVLKYRDPVRGDRKGADPYGPLADGLRAMRLIRSRAGQYDIAPDKIGVMGFSSGGHLCCTISTLYNLLPDPDETLNAVSARPDFTIPVYPVVSFIEDYMHRGSVLRLLGPESSVRELLLFSPERQVTRDTPPAFLVHAADDSGVSCFNSINYGKALVKAGVPMEMHIFAKGGHGFGTNISNTPAEQWLDLLAAWLQKL